MGPAMLLGQGAQEERREAPTSEKAREEVVHTLGASATPGDRRGDGMAPQAVGSGGGAGVEGAGCCYLARWWGRLVAR